MFKVKFGVKHWGCLVNELSREFLDVRIICPGGFRTNKGNVDGVEEIIAPFTIKETLIKQIISFLDKDSRVLQVEVLEKNNGFTFIRFTAIVPPEAQFVSDVVTKNKCFRIGLEEQSEGIESWTVGCVLKEDAQKLLAELKTIGELKYGEVIKGSYKELIPK